MHKFWIQIRETEIRDIEDNMLREEKEQLADDVLERIKNRPQEAGRRGMSGRKGGWSILRILVAAVLFLVVLIPVGAYASNRVGDFFRTTFQKKGYQVELQVEHVETPSASAPAKTSGRRYLREEARNIMVRLVSQGGSEIEYCGYNGEYRRANPKERHVGIHLIWMNVADAKMDLRNISRSEEMTISGHTALYIRKNRVEGSRYAGDGAVRHGLFVFYDEYNCILSFFNNDGSADKRALVQQAKAVTLEKADTEHRDPPISFTEWQEVNGFDTDMAASGAADKESVIAEPVIPRGEETVFVSDGRGYRMKCSVESVEVSDNVKKLDSKGFDGRLQLSKISNKNGKLKSYIREKVTLGDGRKKPYKKVTGKENVQLKMVYVTLNVYVDKGGGRSIDFGYDVEYAGKKNGKYYRDNRNLLVNRPSYLDCCQGSVAYVEETKDKETAFSEVHIPALEPVKVHLGYLVDEDMVNHMLLCMTDGKDTRYLELFQ